MTYATELMEIGSNIRKWRNLRGMKQDVLASAMEISKVTISKIECGKSNISVNRLFTIAKILEIKVELLFKDPLTQVRTYYEEI